MGKKHWELMEKSGCWNSQNRDRSFISDSSNAEGTQQCRKGCGGEDPGYCKEGDIGDDQDSNGAIV
uniref:Uncharacterized protein n=1 Tax=Physcomitrium patens TaxID=3218 RepID=A0A2K1JZ58_PHYPA|nr:hypothetical protein PHYPA_013933 [Physcomitrium patens]